MLCGTHNQVLLKTLNTIIHTANEFTEIISTHMCNTRLGFAFAGADFKGVKARFY